MKKSFITKLRNLIKIIFKNVSRNKQRLVNKKTSIQHQLNTNNMLSNRELLDTNYSDKEIDITHNNGDYIEGLDCTIEEFANAHSKETTEKYLWLGKINNELIQRVFQITNFDLSGKSLVLSSGCFNHLSKHNRNNYQNYGNPAPVEIDILNYLAVILNNAYKIEYVTDNGQDRLLFETDTENNYYYRVIELIPKRNKKSVLVTIYTLKKGDSQGLDTNKIASNSTSANSGNGLSYAPSNSSINNYD